jgi:hypothetical protein
LSTTSSQLVLTEPSKHGLDLSFLLDGLALGQPKSPGQAGQVTDQRRGQLTAEPEPSVRIVCDVSVQVANSKLRLADSAQTLDDDPTPPL